MRLLAVRANTTAKEGKENDARVIVKCARPVLAIHGGAGNAPANPGALAEREREIELALTVGWQILASGGKALDAVEEAVKSMERSGCFNAGRGADIDASGSVTLDAAIMDGTTRAAGAVAAVATVESAIAAARCVMDRTPHVLLVGPGADAFARAAGIPQASPTYFLGARLGVARESTPGTVGAVALDVAGHLAAATSTGGLSGKLPGRVGDSALVGAGTWADGACAVSATGRGEFFIRTAFAHRVTCGMSLLGLTLEEAARRALADVVTLAGSGAAAGGCIAVGQDGSLTMPFATPLMYRGVVDGSGPRVASMPKLLS
jgi:beta-aspartyl-peptidase (threonine type)